MIQLFSFRIFKEEKKVSHFISARSGGYSTGKYSALNLSLKAGDDPEKVTENRKGLADYLGVPPGKLIFPDQCHTDRVCIIDGQINETDLTAVDSIVTNQRGLFLCILTADCVPLVLYDRKRQVIAAIHAGWRGTAGRIVLNTIDRMALHYGTDPVDIIAGIGPAISVQRYEVGNEVAERFRFMFNSNSSVLWENPDTGKSHINLQEANRKLLLVAGVRKENIELTDLCTYSNPELFYSARRDGIDSGRFATGIMLA